MSGRRTRWSAVAAVAAALGMVLAVAPAGPAQALHQACGAKYPAGTLASGHPDTTVGSHGWAGRHVIQPIETTILATQSTHDVLGSIADQIGADADAVHVVALAFYQAGFPLNLVAAAVLTPAEAALRAVATALVVAKAAVLLPVIALQATLLAINSNVADEDACGGTLQGDMINTLWIALVQRNLASAGPPLAMLLSPHDSSGSRPWPLLPQHAAGDFAWCPAISLPAEIPAADTAAAAGVYPDQPAADCTFQVQTGFLDAPDIGVQAIVTNTISHAKDHGLDVRTADALLATADQKLGEGAYKDAYAYFRRAYQEAMRLN